MLTDIGSPRSDEPELGYGQLLQILWRRLYWVLGGLLGGLSLAAIATLILPPKYESTMQLLIEPNVNRSVSLNDPEFGQPGPSFQEIELDYITQLNLMRSKPFINQALTLLEAGVPDLCAKEDTREDCVETFEEDFSLTQVEEDKSQTRIFEAVFTSKNKLRAQKSLEALRSVYLAYNLDQQSTRLTDGLELVDQQIAEVRQDLSQSQTSLQQFRQGEGLIDPEQQSLSAAEALDALALEQQSVRADYQEALAERASVESVLALDPRSAMAASRASQSGRYQSLLDALQKTELALAERLAVYTEADPIVQDLKAERSRNVALLGQESQRLVRQTGGAGFSSESDLLASGQLGEIDLDLVEEMIAAQVKISSLEARQLSLARSEQRFQDKLAQFPRLINQYDQLQPEVETLRASLEQLLELRQELSNDIAQGGFKWAVVEPPAIGEKVAPSPIQNLALGAIAGLFVGGALAYWKEASDTVLRSSEALSKQTRLPMLGGLPEDVEGGAPERRLFGWWRQVLPAVEDSVLSRVQWEPFRDAVDLIYKNIQLAEGALSRSEDGERSLKNQASKSLMVTSARVQEGKTTLAVGLALSAARSQKRVLLIDADLRNPTLHEQLGLANNQGLTQLLTSLEPPMPVNVSLSGVEIDILTAGPLSDDPVLLLNSHRMKELVAKFERLYDLVVIDTSALLGRVDALQIASLCGSVVVVSRLGQTTESDLKKVAAVLGPVNVLGIVANGCDDPFSIHTPAPLVREPELVSAVALNGGSRETSEGAQNGRKNGHRNGNGAARRH